MRKLTAMRQKPTKMNPDEKKSVILRVYVVRVARKRSCWTLATCQRSDTHARPGSLTLNR